MTSLNSLKVAVGYRFGPYFKKTTEVVQTIERPTNRWNALKKWIVTRTPSLQFGWLIPQMKTVPVAWETTLVETRFVKVLPLPTGFTASQILLEKFDEPQFSFSTLKTTPEKFKVETIVYSDTTPPRNFFIAHCLRETISQKLEHPIISHEQEFWLLPESSQENINAYEWLTTYPSSCCCLKPSEFTMVYGNHSAILKSQVARSLCLIADAMGLSLKEGERHLGEIIRIFKFHQWQPLLPKVTLESAIDRLEALNRARQDRFDFLKFKEPELLENGKK